MGVIATLLPNGSHLNRVRAAIRDRHQLAVCDSWHMLATTCAEQPVRVAVIDFYSGDRPKLESLRRLKHRFPRLTVIGYVEFSADRAHDLFEAGRSGVDALIIAERDDSTRGLLNVIGQAEARSLGAAVRRSLESVDPSVKEAVLLAVTRAHERVSPTQLAELLALHRRTLGKRLAAAGFPPPQRLITWGRIIVAAHMLEDATRSANSVATALDFPSGSAFRNTCQRYLHATPETIRARGGATYAVKALLRTVRDSQRARTSIIPATPPATTRTLSLAI
ncbi:MAG TPA: helix-turn-helix domain-containing protein [Gemmatimonadaceae bacterium]|nr:helix-turn-helix domain-containing protein [Gemmatimonadaceae bacterium]